MHSTSHESRLTSRFLLLSIPLALVAGCNNGGGGGGGGGTPPQQQFGATLDPMQEVPAPVTGTRVRVTVTNRAPAMGTFQTPVWMGFHDGVFESFDVGIPADSFFPVSNALERLAEDGDVDPLLAEFASQGVGATQGVARGMLGPMEDVLAPGETVSVVFELDPNNPESRYFSYASMVAPSNDAFVANDDPMAHEIYDAGGNFVASDFTVAGGVVLDAGTEVNDEIPANTTLFGQTTPDTGVDQGGNVALHPGFLAAGMGGILDDPMFVDADFTAPGYEVLSFRFEELPAAASPAIGVATVELTNADADVEFSIAAAGLSGTVTAVHFHEAPAGVAGPIVLSLTDSIVVNENGHLLVEDSLPVPDQDFVDALRAGDIYVNVHTDLNPNGELRGQVEATEAFAGALDTAQEVPAPIAGMGVRVTVTNDAPDMGTFQSAVWVGFHDGNFETRDLGSAADTFFPMTNALERLAEDGSTDEINEAFEMQGFGTTQGVLRGTLGPTDGPIAPGETVSGVFRLDPSAMTSEFLTYASMTVPSNDAFVSNEGPTDVPIYTGASFAAIDFTVPGSAVLDAGTEVNDEVPANTAFFGQMTPDTGVDEGGVVTLHPGFMAMGMGGILDDPMFANADFTAIGYETLSFRFSEVAAGDPASGIVVARLNDMEDEIEFVVLVRDLSGPATAMHFHEAPAGVAGPIVITLTDSIDVNENGILTASGTEPVTSDFVDDLRAGRIYLNVHTALNPAGEVRAQVTEAD